MKKTISYTLALLFMVAGVAFSVNSAEAANVGGVDVLAACENQYSAAYHHEVFLKKNKHGKHDVMSWRCRLNHKHSGSVKLDLNRQCRKQYGGGAEAKWTDFNDPYSWYCDK